MEDGPESLEGSYEYGGETYTVTERDSQVWEVYDGQLLVGYLKALPGGRRGPLYTIKFASMPDFADEEIDDWEAAMDFLIDGPPGG